MNHCDIICRMATSSDDISTIAKYIYLTDDFIYPAISPTPCDDQWIKLFSDCFFAENNVFSAENIVLAELNGKIVGIVCIIRCGERKRFIEDVSEHSPLHAKALKVNEGYFAPLIEESMEFTGYNITNVCVDNNMRGMGIGTALMEFCLDRYTSSIIHLDVIANNFSAIELYKKMGFKITAQYNGFSGTNELLPCYHMEFIPSNKSVN